MRRTIALLYGVMCYLVFLATFLYAVGFVGNLVVPKSIDSGVAGPLPKSLLVDLGLLALFAAQHSLMACPRFKRWWTHFAPEPLERSTYVLFASLALLLLFRQWRPVSGVIWDVENPAGHFLLRALFWLGWLAALFGTFLTHHFDHFGLRQVYLYFRRSKYVEAAFSTPHHYRHVRHPAMLGLIIAFWATPRMTLGHLLFASVTTLYIVVALRLGERDLSTIHREDYVKDMQRVPTLLSLPRRDGRSKSALPSGL